MRNFSKLHEDVCFKRSQGKVIWQPRINCWIDDRMFDKGELPGIYKGMTKADIYKELDCSSRVYEYNDCVYPVYDDTITKTITENGRQQIHKMVTPVGEVTMILESTPSSWAHLVKKYWVTCEEDIIVYTYIEKHTNWAFSQEIFDKVADEWGTIGAPTIFIPRVSMQRLYIDLMGVEEATYALADYPELIEEYFDALRECHFRLIDVVNTCPVDIINFGDNIHSGTLPPYLFEKYVLKEYQERNKRLHEGGKFTCAHFDGDNKGLMEFYQQTGLDGVEAITPIPQGDVTLAEAKKYLGDMVMIDGIPAVYFDEIYSEQTLIDCVHECLDLFAPNLILGISDEISSTGDIERIKLVGKIVDEYNERIEQNNK